MIEDILFLKSGHVDFNAAVIGIGRSRWEALTPDASLDHAIREMQKNRFDVIPIDDGHQTPIRECFYTKELNVWTPETVVRGPITYHDVLPAQTPLYDLIQRFVHSNKLFFFLTYENRISGLVSLANLNSRPVQVWLFAMLCELETRLGRVIKASQITEADILDEISDDEIKQRFQTDREKGLENDITEYMYLKDLLDIIRKKDLYRELRYETKTQFKALNRLNDMRNQVMHPVRSLIYNKQAIDKLWSRLELLQDALFRLRQIQGLY
jgi:hypothetical protein